MRRAIPILMAALCMASLATASPANTAEETIPWITRPPQALQAAKRSGKPVVADLWAVWCQPCRLMERTTYRDPKVFAALDSFVPLKVDADANEVFTERYDVEAYPTTLFLDGEGREIGRLVGLVTAPELRSALDRVRAGYGEYRKNIAGQDDPEALKAAAAYLRRAGNPAGATDLLRRCLKKMKKATPAARQDVELRLAEARLDTGQAGAAAKVLQRLSEDGADDSIRSHALAALVRAERRRGRDDAAAAALERLREEYPDLAQSLSE